MHQGKPILTHSLTHLLIVPLRILVCKNTSNRRIPLYSIFIDPSDYNYFAVSGRDQYARCVDVCVLYLMIVSCLQDIRQKNAKRGKYVSYP